MGWPHKIRGKKYKTDPKNPTGLAICDFCGMNVNGGSLRKYTNYAGAPFPNYSIPEKFMDASGDLMSSGEIIWLGWMVCPTCQDVPNGQSSFRDPTADPYTADGNRPAPNFAEEAVQTYIAAEGTPIEGDSDTEGLGA